MNKQTGFTIIELIVVIAIIAVLATIVLVNVTSYINTSRNAAIKGNLSSLLTNSAVIYDSTSSYATVCSANMVAGKPIYDAVNSAAGGAPTCTIASGNASFCACSILRGGDGSGVAEDVFCVDSTGTKKAYASTGTCAAACPAAGACT